MYKIALLGKANTGKNTVADVIQSSTVIEHNQGGYGRSQLAFADPIKENVRNMFPFLPRKWLYGASKFRNEIIVGAVNEDGEPLTVRQAIIDEGTRGRKYNPNIWLDVFQHRFDKLATKRMGLVIVTDVRFRDEFDYLHDRDFYIVRVKRVTDSKITHASETSQDSIDDSECDYVIDNNGTLDLLHTIITNSVVPNFKGKFTPLKLTPP